MSGGGSLGLEIIGLIRRRIAALFYAMQCNVMVPGTAWRAKRACVQSLLVCLLLFSMLLNTSHLCFSPPYRVIVNFK